MTGWMAYRRRSGPVSRRPRIRSQKVGNTQCLCNTETKMPTIRKAMKTINMRARRVSITAVISSGALSVNTKKYKQNIHLEIENQPISLSFLTTKKQKQKTFIDQFL